jgi:hypothetical protein
VNRAICEGIAARRLLAFDYDGHHRVVEPYCHGTSIDGTELLRAYQVGGTSSSHRLGWKLFDVARAAPIRPLQETFQRRPDYRADDRAMHPVHCCI